MLAWNYWVAIALWIIALGIFIWGILPFIGNKKKKRLPESEERTSVEVENPQYNVEPYRSTGQAKFTIELEAIIKCPNPPQQLANIRLVIAGKAYDFTKTLPPFRDEIATKSVSYRVWYEVDAHNFLLGRIKYPDGTDSTDWDEHSRLQLNGRDIIGQVSVKMGSEPIVSSEFEITDKPRTRTF